MQLSVVFFVFFSAFCPSPSTADSFDFAHLWNQLNTRLRWLDEDHPALRMLPPIYSLGGRGSVSETEYGASLQVFGITPDCYIYTFWAKDAHIFADKYHGQTENTTKWKDKANTRCGSKTIALLETDRDSVPMTLLVVLDAFGRRIRVQSAMNSRFTKEDGILWSKLHLENQMEWYFTQEIDEDYSIKRIIASEGKVLIFAVGEDHNRIFRLRLYKGTNTRIRPYLVRDSELDIDPRIMTPGNANAMMLRSLYVNFANRPFCPYSYLLEYDSLPLYAKEVCDQEWKIFKKNDLSCKNITKYCLPEPWMWLNSNQHGSDIARNDHQRDHIKFTGLIFDWNDEETGITVPILSLMTHSFTGVNPATEHRGYSLIGWDPKFRLTNGMDYIGHVLVPLEYEIRRQNVNYRSTKEFHNSTKLRNAQDTLMREMDGNITSQRRDRLLEQVRLALITREPKDPPESGPTELLYRISSKKLINGGYLHSRMAPPLVMFETVKLGYRVNGYRSRLLVLLLAIILLLAVLVGAAHCIAWMRKAVRRRRQKRPIFTSSAE